jgi:hypothetical protein
LLFNQPFRGAGTAHGYQLTGAEMMAQGSETDPLADTITQGSLKAWALAPVWIGGGATPPTPPAGDLPPEWMAQAVAEFKLRPGVFGNFRVLGTFKDVCGNAFDFRIHPEVGSALLE